MGYLGQQYGTTSIHCKDQYVWSTLHFPSSPAIPHIGVMGTNLLLWAYLVHNSLYKSSKSHLAFLQRVLELPMAKRKVWWPLLPTSPQSTILLIIILVGYSGIDLSIWFPHPVWAELSACLPTSYLLVRISLATQEIHRGTYKVSHIVGHNTPQLN